MAVQSSPYSGTALDTRTFPSTKHIATKAHMAVWRQLVADDTWVQMDVGLYQLINNACVLNSLLDTATYKQLEVRVADTPDELNDAPSDISTVAGIANEIVTVAGIADEVVTVAGDSVNVNLVGDDIALGAGTNQPTDSAILNALTNATDAIDSASAAATSETNAGNSEVAAATSETNAQLSAWEAEAEKLTAESYATEAYGVPVNIVTSDGDGNFTYTPTNPIEYSSLHSSIVAGASSGLPVQTGKDGGVLATDGTDAYWDVMRTPIPTLSGASSANENSDLVITITNYDAGLEYSDPVTTSGTAVRVADEITVSVGGVTEDELDHTVSIRAESGGNIPSEDAVHIFDVLNLVQVPDTDYYIDVSGSGFNATNIPTVVAGYIDTTVGDEGIVADGIIGIIPIGEDVDADSDIYTVDKHVVFTTSQSSNYTQGKVANLVKSTGKFYYEQKLTAHDVVTETGACDDSVALVNGALRNAVNSIAYHTDGTLKINQIAQTAGTAYNVGDVISFAFDLDANTVEIRKNDVLQNSAYTIPSGVSYAPASAIIGTTETVEMYLSTSDFAYTPPVGYLEWNDLTFGNQAIYTSAIVAKTDGEGNWNGAQAGAFLTSELPDILYSADATDLLLNGEHLVTDTIYLGDGTDFESVVLTGATYSDGSLNANTVDTVPTLSSNTSSSPDYIASASTELAGKEAWNAFADSLANGWVTNSVTTGWIQMQYGTAIVINKITMQTSITRDSRGMKDFTIEASNTGAWGGEEVVLSTQVGITDWAHPAIKTFTFVNDTAYLYYRIDCTANNGDATYVQQEEIELIEAKTNFTHGQAFTPTFACEQDNTSLELTYDNGANYEVLVKSATGHTFEGQLTAPELVVNGTFDTDVTGWTDLSVLETVDASNVSGGQLTLTRSGTSIEQISQAISLEIGKDYDISVDIISSSTNDTRIFIGTTEGGSEIVNSGALSAGLYQYPYTATVGTIYILLKSGGGDCVSVLDDASVLENGYVPIVAVKEIHDATGISANAGINLGFIAKHKDVDTKTTAIYSALYEEGV